MSSFLRPPGVVSEKDFKSRCVSCGQCAAVCNYQCIEMTPDYPLGPATPKVFQHDSPCFLCMKCSAICPTDALCDVSMEESDMGMAYLNTRICVDYQEENSIMCWTCFEKCPLKGHAIILEFGYIPKITEDCVGCGVCEYVCPTDAITTTPMRKMSKKTSQGGDE